MRATVCELPHEPEPLDAAWSALCRHTSRERSELVVLPECTELWALETWAAYPRYMFAGTT